MTEQENYPSNQKNTETAADGEHERTEGLNPRIWVGCLAAYTSGTLHGEWLDAAVPLEDLTLHVRAMLARSPEPGAAECAIFDADEFGSYRVGEYDDLAQVAAVARAITTLDAEEAGLGYAFACWVDDQRHSLDTDQLTNDDALCAAFRDAYLGSYDSPEDWAREVLDYHEKELDLTVDERLRPYVQIDYQMWTQDARLDGRVGYEDNPSGGVWIFAT